MARRYNLIPREVRAYNQHPVLFSQPAQDFDIVDDRQRGYEAAKAGKAHDTHERLSIPETAHSAKQETYR